MPHRLDDGVAEVGGYAVASTGGTGGGIRETAGGKDDTATGDALAFLQDDRRSLVLEGLHSLHCGILADSDIGVILEGADERKEDIESLAGGRIDTVATLHDERHTVGLEEVHEFSVEEASVGIAQETGIAAYMRQRVTQRLGVGEVATALAGDAQLAPRLVHLLKQKYLETTFGSGDCSHQSSRTAPHDYDVVLHNSTLKTKN